MNQLILTLVVVIATISVAEPQLGQGPLAQRLAQRFQSRQNGQLADAVRQELCGSLSQQECQTKFISCAGVRRAVKLVDDRSVVRNCASQSDISLFDLLAARDPTKSLDEILEAAGADRDDIKDVQLCVITQVGLVSNGVLDVTTLKERVRPKIVAGVTSPALQSAILGALDTCPQPTIDSFREFRKCIAQTCINNV